VGSERTLKDGKKVKFASGAGTHLTGTSGGVRSSRLETIVQGLGPRRLFQSKKHCYRKHQSLSARQGTHRLV